MPLNWNNIEELHALFKGRVQGVGFRWTVVDHAEKAGLVGTVRNLPNGDVEVIAQGSKESLERFLSSLQKDPGLARIDSLKKTFRLPTQPFHTFTIIK